MTLPNEATGSLAANMVRASATVLPASFDNDGRLFALNLVLMTAFMCLGLMMAGRMAHTVWSNRAIDRPRHPVTIWRLAWMLAGATSFLRCGSEAMNLWAWNPLDPVTTARVLMAKRWIDPAALACSGCCMLLVILSATAMETQLARRPYPINMWASLPALVRPSAVVLLSLIAAVGVAWTR